MDNIQKENNSTKNEQIPQRNRKFGNKKTERLLYSINKQLIEIHNISNIDEEFCREIKDQKEEMNKIIEDFKIILATNKISFDFDQKLTNQQQNKELISETEREKAKLKAPILNENLHTKDFHHGESTNEINYPVNLKSLNSNRNLEILSKEMNKKLETIENETKNNSSSQNLSQRVNSLIQENRDKKNTKSISGKFISKN